MPRVLDFGLPHVVDLLLVVVDVTLVAPMVFPPRSSDVDPVTPGVVITLFPYLFIPLVIHLMTYLIVIVIVGIGDDLIHSYNLDCWYICYITPCWCSLLLVVLPHLLLLTNVILLVDCYVVICWSLRCWVI